MDDQVVTFVGGPLDGATRTWPTGVESELVRIKGFGGAVLFHRYVAATLIDPSAEPWSAMGERRFIYQGRESGLV